MHHILPKWIENEPSFWINVGPLHGGGIVFLNPEQLRSEDDADY
jgi:hypothetical protein